MWRFVKIADLICWISDTEFSQNRTGDNKRTCIDQRAASSTKTNIQSVVLHAIVTAAIKTSSLIGEIKTKDNEPNVQRRQTEGLHRRFAQQSTSWSLKVRTQLPASRCQRTRTFNGYQMTANRHYHSHRNIANKILQGNSINASNSTTNSSTLSRTCPQTI